MKLNSAFAFLIITILFSSCKKTETVEKDKIKLADWLVGNWEHKTDNGLLTESWTKVNGSSFHGQSFFIKGKDTLHNETIELKQQGENLIYSPTVKGQNGDLPVAFKLTSSSPKQLVFENPKHDFPQKITYKKITADSINAEISGKQQGKQASESYPLSRSK